MKDLCPICKSKNIEYFFTSEVPVLQNRVFETISEASSSAKGSVELTNCYQCNFTFNAGFDENIIVYDEKYDNAVPSKLFEEYYRSICEYLYKKYDLKQGVVYDIGCGKGTFLKMLCTLYPNVKGVGIDPSYEGELHPQENLLFYREFFSAEQVQEPPCLILSRHVFEHIEYPKDFLEIIHNPIQSYQDVPVFIEVPDFNWIVENHTFWDICYEHCNYFSKKSIENMFDNTWSHLLSITPSFGDQYLWVEGIFNPTIPASPENQYAAIEKSSISNFVDLIETSKANVSRIISEYKDQKYKVMIWGMATKGVIFTNNMDPEKKLIDFCIDINKEKQNKYSPLTAHLISSPEILETLSNEKCLIIIMNTNYSNEIKHQVSSLGIQAHFIDAHGEVII